MSSLFRESGSRSEREEPDEFAFSRAPPPSDGAQDRYVEPDRYDGELPPRPGGGATRVLLRCKVVLLGDSKVGKSSVVKQFVERAFSDEYEMTLGCEFSTSVVEMAKAEAPDAEAEAEIRSDPGYPSNSVEFYIHDVSGSPLYSPNVSGYLKNANFVVLMYDVSNAQTFANITRKWIQFCRSSSRSQDDKQDAFDMPARPRLTPGILIGNKIDLRASEMLRDSGGSGRSRSRFVDSESARDFAQQQSLDFVEISAKDQSSVLEVFGHLAGSYLRRYEDAVERVTVLSEDL